MFNINNSDMNKIKKESLSNVLDRVELREKVENKYKISIFSIEINSEQELEETWNDISHEIANSYQSKFLHNDIEIWNVYLIFFYSDFISDNLKYSIESNKFSSRKLVLKNDNSSIDDLIYNKLFSLNIKKYP
ncbi:ABC-three component system middle component 1 [Exiguobacterium artemiae]